RQPLATHARAVEYPSDELLQEPNVVFVQKPDVGNPVALHGDSPRPHAEGESGIPLRVIPDRFENGRIHHPRSHDLHATGALAGATSGALADLAGDIHLRRGFGEGEEGWAEPGLRAGPEEPSRELPNGGAEIPEIDPFVHREPLELLEAWGVRGIERIAPIHHARDHHADGWRKGLHDPR